MPGARPQSGMTVTPFAAAFARQPLLLEDDLGVAAEVAEMHAGFHRQLGERKVEVVRNRAHRPRRTAA